ncbi:MAG TPA: UDP-glucose/GDP-mannose dehydrogenase family protein [Saprospiraceae bacterium]|nr:UDP-glucose/GDP-mannose dehydrogenase family protein [Saprospiraceae bacterium]HNT19423.1 UDP-glucose/GDP-mannose dehydrogenase family protein [Saprospiraceae bacterium]
MDIGVIGTGYVGLVTGTCFAEMGHQVICVDIDAQKVSRLNQGRITIYEPGLENLFERNTRQGRLTFTTELKKAVDHAEIIFLALPTPPGEDGSADLSAIIMTADQLGDLIQKYTIVVNKSTVPVGTAEKVAAVLGDKLDNNLFDVVSNPEFLREGVAVEDFMKPDRVVIGSSSEKALERMKHLYDPFVRQGNPILTMDLRSAEMTKYAANAYLATRITFMNEIANLCERAGADVDMVRRGIGSDNRIGKRFLFPGIGYGGSCFPKDVMALIQTAREFDYEMNILNSVVRTNQDQKHILTAKLEKYFMQNLGGKQIAIWGLAFKPNTDDIREAPALTVIDDLLARGAKVRVFDPEAMDHVKDRYGDQIQYGENEYEVLDQADALVIATEWSLFRAPEFDRIKSLMKTAALFDGRNLYDLDDIPPGFYYESIGRKTISTL